MEFQDKVLKCIDCGTDFVFTAGEQLFFHDKQFKNEPKRCKNCKGKRVAVLVRIPNHFRHAGKRGNFCRCALRVATCDHNLAAWILPVDAPNGGAGVLIGRRSDRAGVQHHQFSVAG